MSAVNSESLMLDAYGIVKQEEVTNVGLICHQGIF